MSWLMNAGWQPGLSCDVPHQLAWHGTECAGSTILRLKLVANGLRGTLPTELGHLPDLKELLVESNPLLSGTIPTEIGGLRALRTLSFDNNTRLSGSIPATLDQMSNLEYLSAHTNSLSGALPEQIVLNRLQYLDLSQNMIGGHMPPPLHMSNARYLSLHTNRISGTLSNNIGRLDRLIDRAYLHRNQISGFLPSQLGNLTQIPILSLRENSLSGTLPTELGSLTLVNFPALSYNRVSGTVPSELTVGKWGTVEGRLDLMSNLIDDRSEQEQFDAQIVRRPYNDATPFERSRFSTAERAISAWYERLESGQCEWRDSPRGRFQCSISASRNLLPKVDYRSYGQSAGHTTSPHPDAYGNANELEVLAAQRG